MENILFTIFIKTSYLVENIVNSKEIKVFHKYVTSCRSVQTNSVLNPKQNLNPLSPTLNLVMQAFRCTS